MSFCILALRIQLILTAATDYNNSETDSPDFTWTIPASILPATLSGNILLIDKFIEDPLDASNGKSIKDLLQARRKARAIKVRSARIASSPSSSNEAISGEPEVGADGEIIPNKRKKDKRSRVLKRGRGAARENENSGGDDEGKKSRKRAEKRAQEAVAYKSAQFVRTSV